MSLTRTKNFAVSALMGATFLAAAGASAFAQEAKPREAVIMVSGEGQAAMSPDTALVTLSVVKQAKSAHDALDQNNKAMGAVLDQLEAADRARVKQDDPANDKTLSPFFCSPVDK